MCDPVTAAGLALSAGGTFLQQREANNNARRVANAKNAEYVRSMNQQRQFADEAGAAFSHSVDKQGKSNFDDQKELESNKIKQAFSERKVQPDYNVGLSSNAPKNVILARESASQKAGEESQRDVDNLADLYGYSGALFNQNLDRNEFARLFGNVQDKASAQNRLLPLRINAAANNAQKSPSLFPTLLKTAGQGLSVASAGGAFDPEIIYWNDGGSTVLPRTGPFGNLG